MLQTSELRIGNRLTYADKEIIVEGIVRNTIHHSNGQFDQNITPAYEPFKGIKLTEEWFLRAGFIRKNGYGRIHSKLKGNIFISECGSYYVYQYYDIRIELKFVHQFQNLYFAICGEELVFSTEP